LKGIFFHRRGREKSKTKVHFLPSRKREKRKRKEKKGFFSIEEEKKVKIKKGKNMLSRKEITSQRELSTV